MQVPAEVLVGDFCLEVLFYIVPDNYLSSNTMIGGEILLQGFSVSFSSEGIVLSRSRDAPDTCEIKGQFNCNNKMYFEKIDTDVTPEYRPHLIAMLKEFSVSFSQGISKTRERRPYRLSAQERQVVRDKVNELFLAGVIRPVLLVKKKDGSDRLCLDYRELNDNTVADTHFLL